ncbi:MAG: 5-(carboxyamino)imidazole ribonucleotide synthase [Synechococcus sp.]
MVSVAPVSMTSTTAVTGNPWIGVVGGGQLARMLVQAAHARDVAVLVQTASADDPAAKLADAVLEADPNNAQATQGFLGRCGGITFENEWVSIDALAALERKGACFWPSLISLQPLVNKLHQRQLLDQLAIPSPAWVELKAIDPGTPALPKGWSFPVMAKAATGGYDGKGTQVIRSVDCLAELLRSVDPDNWLLERWVDYERELALVVSRDQSGRVRALPLVETQQSEQVCDWVLAPAVVDQLVEATAYNIAASLLTKLDYVGVLAIEMFYGPEGLLVNEIAPRTHNSGHFSIEACKSSQFDQQLCIAAGLDVPDPELNVPGALMVNLLGLAAGQAAPLEQRLAALQADASLHLHWYDKQGESEGRKLGHVTVLLSGADAETRRREAMNALEKVRSIWPLP